MIQRSYSSDGVVLSRRNYGEADRILTVYSRNYGKLNLLAKGVRKPKSKKRGHIEVFSRIRFSASRGTGLDFLTEAETVDSFESVRKDLRRTSLAYYFCEVVSKITREEEKNEQIFDNFIDNLSLLSKRSDLKSIRRYFVFKMLVILGFWPENKKLDDVDRVLSEVTEREMSSVRIGKKMLA